MYKEKYNKYKKKYLELIKSMKGGVSEKVHKIYGPNSLNYYNVILGEGITKKILMFGEVHHSSYEECNDEFCINIIDFLEELTQDKCIDFFLEFSPTIKEGYNMTGGGNLMIQLRKFALTLQKKDNIRIQKWDLRTVSQEDGLHTKSLSHEILKLSEIAVSFLENYGNFNMFYHTDRFYKDNIKLLHLYLYGLQCTEEQMIKITNIISILSICNIVNKEKNYPKKLPFNINAITSTHKNLLEVINIKEYIYILEFSINIISKSKGDLYGVLNYIGELQDIKIYDGNSQTLYYNPEEEKIKEKINNIIDASFDASFEEEPDLYKNPIIKNIIMKNKKSIINYINEIIYVKNISLALTNEIFFYKEMNIIKNKLDKLYKKFLLFCEEYPTIFGNGIDIKEKIIEIIMNEKNFKNRFNEKNSLSEDIQMGLNSAITDLYALLRMFIIFDKKEREPNKCNNILTPMNIIVYAGQQHIELYESIFSYYENINLIIKISKNINDEILYKEKIANQQLIIKNNKLIEYNKNKKEKYIKNIEEIKNDSMKLAENIREIYVKTLTKQYIISNSEIDQYIKKYIDENNKLININKVNDDILSKFRYSDRYINIKNSNNNYINTVNELSTHFLH